MKTIKVNSIESIELHDKFINVVREGGIYGNRKHYTPTDKRDIWNLCKMDKKETMAITYTIPGCESTIQKSKLNCENTIQESRLIIIGIDGRTIVELDFVDKDNRDLVYDELRKDILSRTK